MAAQNRPLSPHLQIYKKQITSVMSILHRMTGIALMFGAVVLSYWLISATYGPESFQTAQAMLGSWFGRLVLFGLTFSLFYHLGNGVRHLGWDFGMGFELSQVRSTGIAVVVFSVVLTLLTWFAGYAMIGGA